LMKYQASWSESAKNLANQSLNARLERRVSILPHSVKRRGEARPVWSARRRNAAQNAWKGGSETCSVKLGDVRRSGDRVRYGGDAYC
jgi:hypothetical protein